MGAEFRRAIFASFALCVLAFGLYAVSCWYFNDELSQIMFLQTAASLAAEEKEASSRMKGSQEVASPAQSPMCSAKQRSDWVRYICRQNNLTNPEALPYSQLLVDESKGVIYCQLPKVACTTIKAIMVASGSGIPLSDILPEHTGVDKLPKVHRTGTLRAGGLRWLHTYPMEERHRMLESFYKFIVVRHPFDRLMSVYGDKIEYLRSISEVYPPLRRKKSYIESLPGISHPAFQDGLLMLNWTEFLTLVVAGFEPGGQSDFHWWPYHERCGPCEVDYDGIIKLETLDQEVDSLLERFPGPDGKPYQLPYLNRVRDDTAKDKVAEVSQAFSRVDRKVIDKLLAAYRTDMDMFGYGWDGERTAATCSVCATSGSSDECCC